MAAHIPVWKARLYNASRLGRLISRFDQYSFIGLPQFQNARANSLIQIRHIVLGTRWGRRPNVSDGEYNTSCLRRQAGSFQFAEGGIGALGTIVTDQYVHRLCPHLTLSLEIQLESECICPNVLSGAPCAKFGKHRPAFFTVMHLSLVSLGSS
jgi:hypothetical protein